MANYSHNSLSIRLLTYLKGALVGQDEYENKYYLEKQFFGKFGKPLRRWVLYNGIPEGSKIPPQWFGWLHFTHEAPLSVKKHAWEKPFQPNLTGTQDAYHPKGSLLNPVDQDKNNSSYEPWKP